MKRELIIQRMQTTLDMLGKLKESQFDFHTWVSEWDKKNCGTICCVLGWYPVFIPESKIIWDCSISGGIAIDLGDRISNDFWFYTSQYHGFKDKYKIDPSGDTVCLMDYLFTPADDTPIIELPKWDDIPHTLSWVTHVWRKTLYYIKTTKRLDPWLDLS